MATRFVKTRPPIARPRMQKLAGAFIEVRTEQELIQALNAIRASGKLLDEDADVVSGGTVIICASFGVAATVVVPDGVTITSAGRQVLSATRELDPMFDAGNFVTLDGLHVAVGASPATVVVMFASLGTLCTVRGCNVEARGFIEASVGGGHLIESNYHRSDPASLSTAREPTTITIASGSARIVGNDLERLAGAAHLIHVTSGGCVIVGNICNSSGDIDTAGSAGSNVIDGNASVSAIVPHGTDAVGDNT